MLMKVVRGLGTDWKSYTQAGNTEDIPLAEFYSSYHKPRYHEDEEVMKTNLREPYHAIFIRHYCGDELSYSGFSIPSEGFWLHIYIGIARWHAVSFRRISIKWKSPSWLSVMTKSSMKNINGGLLYPSNGLKYLLAFSILQKNLHYLGISL